MVRVGTAGIERELGIGDASSCGSAQPCFHVGNPTRAMVGTNAGTFYGLETCGYRCQNSGCYVFLSHDSTGWSYVDGRCLQSFDQVPGASDEVHVGSGCANVRDAPSLSGRVLTCLTDHFGVSVDSAPTYADGHIWWHLVCLGWMAHDFLITQPGLTSSSSGAAYPPNCQGRTQPSSPIVDVIPDAGSECANFVIVGSGFPGGAIVALYEDHPNPFWGTPGPQTDALGDFTLDSIAAPYCIRGGPGVHQLCGDTTIVTNQQYSAKACGDYTISSIVAGAPPSPSATATIPVATTVQPAHTTTGTALPILSIAAGAVGGAAIVATLVLALLRRRSA